MPFAVVNTSVLCMSTKKSVSKTLSDTLLCFVLIIILLRWGSYCNTKLLSYCIGNVSKLVRVEVSETC